jgi:hypothetical protein
MSTTQLIFFSNESDAILFKLTWPS